jgi:hypothetical protein
MRCSLNEIDAAVRKSARGAGLAWGLAEEAGMAARWLEARRLGGLALFATLFEHHDGTSYEQVRVRATDRIWIAAGGVLCPIVTGAALADHAEGIAAGVAIETGPMLCPLILAPFVALATRAAGRALDLEWSGIRLRFDGDDAGLDGAPESLRVLHARRTACRLARDHSTGPLLEARSSAVLVDPAIWARLDRFAQRTYVPASEASRVKGAGAGMIDND